MKKFILALGLVALVPALVFAATTRYTVKNGDTLNSIATKNGITLQQLVDANPNLVGRGDRLNIPTTGTTPSPTPTPTPTPTPSPTPTPPPTTTGGTVFTAYVTGYTYYDNTPPGTDISNPIIHTGAGGVGTYSDPITLAVGHSFATGKDVLDYPAGTKFYVVGLNRYFIVEDTCGDGNHPEDGPCHKNTDEPGVVWLDAWIGGQSGNKTTTNTCAENITKDYTVIMNPIAGLTVTPGAIFENGCK